MAKKDELVEKLKAELGIEEDQKPEPKKERGVTGQKASGATPAGDEISEEARRKTVPAGPRAAKPGEQKQRGKKYLEASEGIEKTKAYPVKEAVTLAKKASYSKFDGTMEAHISTNVKSLRGAVMLPFASGKKVRILAFGKDAEKSGADMTGDDKKLAEIQSGKVDFDYLITTPEWMGKIAPLAKVLGPKGLMPNPKNGTITENLSKTVSELQGGKTEYKTEQNGKVMHLSIGKISQNEDELCQNIKVLVQTVGKTKIKKFVIAPTMGAGVKIDLASI